MVGDHLIVYRTRILTFLRWRYKVYTERLLQQGLEVGLFGKYLQTYPLTLSLDLGLGLGLVLVFIKNNTSHLSTTACFCQQCESSSIMSGAWSIWPKTCLQIWLVVIWWVNSYTPACGMCTFTGGQTVLCNHCVSKKWKNVCSYNCSGYYNYTFFFKWIQKT